MVACIVLYTVRVVVGLHRHIARRQRQRDHVAISVQQVLSLNIDSQKNTHARCVEHGRRMMMTVRIVLAVSSQTLLFKA